MIARMLAGLFALALSTGASLAQNCGPYPNTLTNGQPADANQVMANFNAILNCANAMQPLQGYIAGLIMANNAVSPNTAIDTSAGVTVSDDTTTLMKIAAFTKNASAAWSLGAGNGCLDSGSSLAANTWYHMFVIARTDTGVIDELCSTSVSSPTMPASYTKKRRIGSFRTNASSQIIPFVQNGNYFAWKTFIMDVAAANPGISAVPRTLTVPTGVRVQAKISAGFSAVAAGDTPAAVLVSDLAISDQTPNCSAPTFPLTVCAWPSPQFVSMIADVWTDTAAQVRSRVAVSTSGTTLLIGTLGWTDLRGQ